MGLGSEQFAISRSLFPNERGRAQSMGAASFVTEPEVQSRELLIIHY
jgi:hypothetical protein